MITKIVLLGAPGSGKGTLATKLKELLKVPHISTGAIFREHIRKGTEIGKIAETYIKRGELVPDYLAMEVMENRILKPDCKNGYIFDGFPRSLNQATLFQSFLDTNNIQLESVINIAISDEEAIKRISGRRICQDCGENYNIHFHPSANSQCDRCAGTLIQRQDDREELVTRRLYEYHKITRPLEGYYANIGLLNSFQAKLLDQLVNEVMMHLS